MSECLGDNSSGIFHVSFGLASTWVRLFLSWISKEAGANTGVFSFLFVELKREESAFHTRKMSCPN